MLAVENRRRNERRSSRTGPNEVRACNVALAAWTNSQSRAGAAGRAEQHSIAHDRCGNDLEQASIASPDLTTCIRVVRLDSVLAVHDDLVAAGNANGDGCPPAD